MTIFWTMKSRVMKALGGGAEGKNLQSVLVGTYEENE